LLSRAAPDVMILGFTYSANQFEVRFAARLASELPSFRFAVSGVRKAPVGCPPNLEIGFFDRVTYTNYMRGRGWPRSRFCSRRAFRQGIRGTGVQQAGTDDVSGPGGVSGPQAVERGAVEDDPRRFAETIRYLLEDGRASKDLSSGARAYYPSSPSTRRFTVRCLARAGAMGVIDRR